MKKFFKRLAMVVVGIIVLIVVLIGGFIGLRSMNILITDDTMMARFPVPEHQPVNFEDLVLKDSPNQFLVCDPAVCSAEPHQISEVYDLPVLFLRRHFSDIIAGSPRTQKVNDGDHFMQSDYVQRTPMMQYPDLIAVRYVSLSDDTSALYIYSRSVYGYGDGGVNKARVEGWLSELSEVLP